MDLIIITNGPGELASWAKATVTGVRNKRSDIRISIFLPPCPFSSGQEERVARDITGIDTVLNPRQFVKFLIYGKTADFIPSRKGLVVFLGGDPLHALMVSLRTGFPSIAYMDKASFLNKYFLHSLVPDEFTREKLLRAGIKSSRVRVIGNLLIEGVKINFSREKAMELFGMKGDIPVIGIMPGSRPPLFRHSLPYFLRVSEEIRNNMEVQFILGLSSHISMDILEHTLCNVHGLMAEGSSGVLKRDDRGLFIETERKVMVRVMQNMAYDIINCSDLLLTIPGTITAEAAFLGVPMFVCYSYNKPEDIPVGGLPAILGKIPLVGPLLKYIVWRLTKKIKFFAIPNIAADRMIVPEIRVISRAVEVSSPVLEFLREPAGMRRVSEELKNLFKSEGASRKMADIILETMETLS